MARFFKIVVPLILVGVLGFIFRDPLIEGFLLFRSDYFPCRAPIEYSLGTFDTKFGISKEAFLADLKEAEAIWEKEAQKDLFNYSDDGRLKINLIYDYRQQATDTLKGLGIVVEDNQNSYDALKAKHDSLEREYLQAKTYYESRVVTFGANKKVYEDKVDYWNSQGGAPKDEYNKLQQEQDALKVEANELNRLQINLNEQVNQINALVVALNEQARIFNLTASEYNQVGHLRGEEFQEGLYVRDGFNQKIDIYEFSDKEKLIRVLAHEFGHALGLDHVNDPDAIMYKLNQGENSKLSEADLTAVKIKCRID